VANEADDLVFVVDDVADLESQMSLVRKQARVGVRDESLIAGPGHASTDGSGSVRPGLGHFLLFY
jgi:hypothetical protein